MQEWGMGRSDAIRYIHVWLIPEEQYIINTAESRAPLESGPWSQEH